jgi:hypothetical protein
LHFGFDAFKQQTPARELQTQTLLRQRGSADGPRVDTPAECRTSNDYRGEFRLKEIRSGSAHNPDISAGTGRAGSVPVGAGWFFSACPAPGHSARSGPPLR